MFRAGERQALGDPHLGEARHARPGTDSGRLVQGQDGRIAPPDVTSDGASVVATVPYVTHHQSNHGKDLCDRKNRTDSRHFRTAHT